jgi:hypothetical protein
MSTPPITSAYYKCLEIYQTMSESESTRKDFPDWENLYKSQSVETMPWYNERFDSDLESELDQRKIIANGKKFLDLGTGPAHKLYG